ncbi:hypothetical protein HA44_22210 [Mixta gaviniae]|nr:hypothetical protein HA44_22210 [Mixta gaviniae]
MKRLSLPRLNAEEAQLRQRIGAGQCFPYQLNDEAGTLTLRLSAAAPDNAVLALRCDAARSGSASRKARWRCSPLVRRCRMPKQK